jgi:O-antigen ligase
MIIFTLIAVILILATAGLLFTPYAILAPLMSIGVMGLLVLYKKPEWGLLGIIFLVPFEGLFAGAKIFTGSKLIGVALIGVVGIKILLGSFDAKLLRSFFWVPIVFFIAIYILGGMLSVAPGVSLNSLRQLFTAVLIFAVSLVLVPRLDYRLLMRVFAVSVCISAFFALITGSATSLEERTAGLATDPNYFALLLCVAMPMSFYLMVNDKHFFLKLVWSLAILILLVALMKSFSRAAFLILGMIFLLGVMHHRDRLRHLQPRHFGWLLLTIAIGLPVFFVVVPEEYVDRILSLTNIGAGASEDRSLGRRTSYIVVGLDTLKAHPLIGTGPGTFPIYFANTGFASAFSFSSSDPELYRRAHNTYLEVLSETGILGFLMFITIVGIGLRNFYVARQRFALNNQLQAYEITSHFALSFLALCMFLLFLSATNHKYLWLLLAVSHVLRSVSEDKEYKIIPNN